MFDLGEYCNPDVGGAELDCFNSCFNKKHTKMSKRFSDEQIKSLETIFESESKLQPRKKLQLAKELGLQPKQVAIWFQNKRARWKSKQIQRDYNILKANYDSLSSQFDLLKTENQSLLLQLKKLQELMDHGEPPRTGENSNNSNNAIEKQPNLSVMGLGIISDDDSSMKTEYPDMLLVDMVEQGDGSLTSAENWDDLDPDPLLDESTITDTSNQWWDFWG